MIWSIFVGVAVILAISLPVLFFLEAQLEGLALIWLLIWTGGWFGYISWASNEEAKAVQQPTVIELSVDNV